MIVVGDRTVSYDEYADKHFSNHENVTDDDYTGLEEKYQKTHAEEIELEKQDIKAYAVLEKYNKIDFHTESLIYGEEENEKLMHMMADLMFLDIEKNEKELLYSYIERRVSLFHDETKTKEFSEILKKFVNDNK